MNNWSRAPQIDNQRRYLTVAVTTSGAPVLVIALLPEPLHSALLPIAAILGAYATMYGLALLLLIMESAWRLLRRSGDAPIRCPTCHTVEQPYRRFYVNRLAPQIFRIHCPECHERWVERR